MDSVNTYAILETTVEQKHIFAINSHLCYEKLTIIDIQWQFL